MTFGPAPGLGASVFTVETWFRRDGAGIATNTGSGGVVAVPLVTKGMAEVEGSNRDMNYFLGIRQSDGVLAADFEDTATGLNHPVVGVTNDSGQRRVAPRGGHLRRHDVAPVSGRRPRRAARRRRLHAARGQHSARRDWDGVQLDGRHHERPDAGVLRRRDRRSAHLEPRADAAADQPRADPRNHERARVCWDAGASTKAPARSSPTAPVTPSTGRSRGRTGPGWPARPSRPQGNTAPVAADDAASTAMQTPVVDRRAGQRRRCRRRRAGGDGRRSARARHGGRESERNDHLHAGRRPMADSTASRMRSATARAARRPRRSR